MEGDRVTPMTTTTAYGFTTYSWVPWALHAPAKVPPFGWLKLPAGRFLALNCVDYDDVVVWSFGPLALVRPETDEERADREDAEAEASFMAVEANRFIEWY